MAQEKWTQVDSYLSNLLLPNDTAPETILKRNRDANLPPIDVSPPQGKLLHLLTLISNSKRVLEIGTLGGYSTTWFAQAVPSDGKVVSLEVNEHHASVARANIAAVGLEPKVTIITGPAERSLAKLHEDKVEKFDLVFIDADKPNNPVYLKWAIELVRDGGIVIGDNVVRGGRVVESDSTDENVRGTREFLRLIGEDERLDATAVQTVGVKGYDGFVIARVHKGGGS